MKKITITRTAVTTYTTTVDVPEKVAERLLDFPELNTHLIEKHCPTTDKNRTASKNLTYAVTQP